MKILAKHFFQARPGEHVRLTVREYFITRLPQLTIVSLLYVIWWFCFYLFFSWGWWGRSVWVSGLVVMLWYSVRRWVVWQNDCCIITDQRFIDIQKRGIFDTSVREVLWTMTQDVHYTQRGLWATVCGYGTVIVVVKDAPSIQLQHVYQPAMIRDILSQYVPTLH